MIPVSIEWDCFTIRNVAKNELSAALHCINETESNYSKLGRSGKMDFEEISQRYLESLMNSMEFFCGIFTGDHLIGIIKGRIENKPDKELLILSYLLSVNFRSMKIGTRLLGCIEDYFHNTYAIDYFYILLTENNAEGKNFWLSSGYSFSRSVQTPPNEAVIPMILLQKKLT